MRTIKVTGKGTLKVHPDRTQIYMTLEGGSQEYETTMEQAQRATEGLASLLGGYGFSRQDLKTLSFNVNPAYESYQEEGAYRQRFIGYRYDHRLRIDFDADHERLGKVLYGLATSQLAPQFEIGYTVKDREAVKNQLLADAVRDSAEKARVLAEAAGLALGPIDRLFLG